MLNKVHEIFTSIHNKQRVAFSKLCKYVYTVYPMLFTYVKTSETGCFSTRLSFCHPAPHFPPAPTPLSHWPKS